MKISFFFTRNVSLRVWVDAGLFYREKLIHEAFVRRDLATEVTWYTYGSRDASLAEELRKKGLLIEGIFIKEMPSIFNVPKIGSWLYSVCLPFVYFSSLKNSDILISNQLDGAWAACMARMLLGKPFVARCGYVASKMEERLHRLSKHKIAFIRFCEKLVLKNSDYQIVSSLHDSTYIKRSYGLDPDRVIIVRNWIDCSIFSRRNPPTISNRLLFVGRLNSQKNIENLIRAIAGSGYGLDIVGDGELRNRLSELVQALNADVKFLGRVSNCDLPKIIERYRYFVLPSLVEGMPKTLLEAMACETVCLGSDVEGINEVIDHRVDGFLIGVDSSEIRNSLASLHEFKEGTLDKIAENAREKIVKLYSFDRCIDSYRHVFDLIFKKAC